MSPNIVFFLHFLSFNLRLGKIGTWPIVVFNIYVLNIENIQNVFEDIVYLRIIW